MGSEIWMYKMNDSDLRCRGRGDCPTQVAIACNCGIPVVLLCEGCISTHVLKPGSHRLLHLNQAKQLLSSSSSSGHYEESYIRYLRIKTNMLAYIDSLKDFKSKATAFKVEIMDQIEKTFDVKLEQIDSILNHTYIQLYELNQESDHQTLQKYEEKGLEGVISNYIYNMNLNVDDLKHSLNNLIRLETRNSPQIEARYQPVLPIEIQELRELIKDQNQRCDELENILKHLQDKSQLQEACIKELKDKAQDTEVCIRGLDDRSQMHDKSMKQLEDNIRVIDHTLEKLKSHPNSLVQQTNQTIQAAQKLFNEKYANIDQEINNIKQLTTQIQQVQAEHQAREKIKPQPPHTPRQEEVKQPQPLKIPEFEEVKLPQRLATPRVNEEVKSQAQLYSRSTSFTLKNGTRELIKYDSDSDTITTYLLNNLPYGLYSAATCMLPDGSIIIAGGK